MYEDIKQTFRAPFVNWVFRTTMANYPGFLRYAWGQVKPVLQTRAFAQFSVKYHDTLLSAVEDEFNLPTYRCGELDVQPAEYRELQGQLATFDIVTPRLAFLFDLMDRSLYGKPVGTNPEERRAATEPYPDWLDRDRGLSATMLSTDLIPEELDEVIRRIKDQHGLKQQLPSIYRCLAQWPGFLTPA